jgi:hypothetical protein
MENRSCPSEFTLERWRFGELAGLPEEAQLVEHLKECPACSQKQAELARESTPPSLNVDAIWANGRGEDSGKVWGSGRRHLGWGAGALAGASMALALVFLIRPSSPDILSKGGAWHLGIVAKSKSGTIMRLDPGAPLSPGDRLRFEVFTSLPRAEIALVMLDGAGQVSQLAPSGEHSLSIAGGRQVLLQETVELDAHPGPERVVLVGCSERVRVADVVTAARRALAEAHGDPRLVKSLGTGCHEESFWISKVQP